MRDVPTADGSAPRSPDILVVCTANIARSPLFAVRLQAEADRRLGPGLLTVGSAGTEARWGDRAARGSQHVADRWGLSLEAHASRSLVYVPLDDVSLFLAMTRAQVRSLEEHGVARARCFTVLELVRILGRSPTVARDPADEGPTDRSQALERLTSLLSAAADRRPGRTRLRRSLDVPDPIGAGQPIYDRLAERFEEQAALIGEAAFGPVRPGSGSRDRG
jgi:protein-tyrosine-phosphatase